MAKKKVASARRAVSAAKTKTKTKTAEPAVLSFATKAAWSAWLGKHRARTSGVWLKIAKKDSKIPSLDYAEALEVALAWGFIDGQKRKFDEAWWLQRFTPRGTRSIWSKINREKAEGLIASGAMKASGLSEVERARRDGRWQAAYASQSKAQVPPDLAAPLGKNPRAARFFEALDSHNRYAILFRVHSAKKPATRAERIARFVAMCAAHETIHAPRSAKRRASATVRSERPARKR